MNKEFLYMQKLAGIITESEYKSQSNENQFEMVGSKVEVILDAINLINGKNIAKLKPLAIKVELENSEDVQKINSFLEERGFQSKINDKTN